MNASGSAIREKLILVAAILFGAWTAAKFFFGMPDFQAPDTPRIQGLAISTPSEEISLEPPNLAAIWQQGSRNFTEPAGGYPKHLSADTILHAMLSRAELRLDVDIVFHILAEPVERLTVELPANFTLSRPPRGVQATVEERGRQRFLIVPFEQPIRRTFNLSFELSGPITVPGRVEIPAVKPDVETETGYIAISLRDNLAMNISSTGTERIRPDKWHPIRRPPSGAVELRRYERHPYRLTADVRMGTAPPTPPPTTPPGTSTPPVQAVQLKVGSLRVGEGDWVAIITDAAGVIPTRTYRVGDTIPVQPAPLRVIRVTPSAVFVQDSEGKVQELKEVPRERYRY